MSPINFSLSSTSKPDKLKLVELTQSDKLQFVANVKNPDKLKLVEPNESDKLQFVVNVKNPTS